MMRKTVTTMIKPKLELVEVIRFHHKKKKTCVEIGKNTENNTKTGAKFVKPNI